MATAFPICAHRLRAFSKSGAQRVPLIDRLILSLAGVMGALGVASAAAAAHLAPASLLSSGALILLVHAPALIAVLIALHLRMLPRIGGRASMVALALGALLFPADMASRSFLDGSLFPFAAPIGGFLLMGGWILLAISGIFSRAAA